MLYIDVAAMLKMAFTWRDVQKIIEAAICFQGCTYMYPNTHVHTT